MTVVRSVPRRETAIGAHFGHLISREATAGGLHQAGRVSR